jgi:hypothetical protein
MFLTFEQCNTLILELDIEIESNEHDDLEIESNDHEHQITIDDDITPFSD